MKKKAQKKEKKDRWWLWDVFEFFVDIWEILLHIIWAVLLFIPRLVIRIVREW